MATATSTPMTGQPAQRRPALFKDQHGRTWFTIIDKRTGHPVDTMEPKFEAPWYPHQSYVRVLPDSLARPNEVQIHYEEAIADLERAHANYQQALLNAGIELHGQMFDETKPSLAVLHRVGKPPKPVAPYRAAQAGNTWILGLEPFDALDPDHLEAAEALGRRDLLPASVSPAKRRKE